MAARVSERAGLVLLVLAALTCATRCIESTAASGTSGVDDAEAGRADVLSSAEMFASQSLREDVLRALEIYGKAGPTIQEFVVEFSASFPLYASTRIEDMEEAQLVNLSIQVFQRAEVALESSELGFVNSNLLRAYALSPGGAHEDFHEGEEADAPISWLAPEPYALYAVLQSALLGHRDGVALLARVILLGLYDHTWAEDVAAEALAVPRALERSWALFLLTRAADAGSPAAHATLGLLYSAGVLPLSGGGRAAVPLEGQENDSDGDDMAYPARSLLHLYMGASGGDAWAQLSLGYRHEFGLGVPKSCQTASLYYDTPAFTVAELARGPGSKLRHFVGAPDKFKLTSAEAARSVRWHNHQHREGTDGEGRERNGSMIDAALGYMLKKIGQHNQQHYTHQHNQLQQQGELDLIEYYEFKASAGHAAAQTAMGEIFAYGSNGMTQDYARAAHYFEQAVDYGPDKEALAHLGHMYANGLGVRQSNDTAMHFFRQAVELGSAHGMYGLGYMYLAGFTDDGNAVKGQETRPDVNRAMKYLHMASKKGHVESIFLLGVMYLNGWEVDAEHVIGKITDVIQNKDLKGMPTVYDAKNAYNYMQIAAYAGHPIAMYNTAMMRLVGLGTDSSCDGAMEMLKPLAERLAPETRLLEYAYREVSGRVDIAALSYLLAAHAGIEVAQANAAYLMQHGAEVDFFPVKSFYRPKDHDNGSASLQIHSQRVDTQAQALKCHKFAAEQGNMASLLAIGDMYYYGYGVACDMGQAGEAYRNAAETAVVRKVSGQEDNLAGGRQKSEASSPDGDVDFSNQVPAVTASHAYFNLGVMHHLGLGLSKDLHLAKRFYDLSRDTHSSASGPCSAALFVLRLHNSFGNWVSQLTSLWQSFLKP